MRSAKAGAMLFALTFAAPAFAQQTAVNAAATTGYNVFPLLSESEAGGVGCAVAMVAAGAVTVQLMGGPAAVAALVAGPAVPLYVLEAGAATAFLLSSACYVGQAMTPIGTLAVNSVVALGQ